MNRRSFFKGLLTAGAAVVVAPASVLDELAKEEHRRAFENNGRVYVDMGRVQPGNWIEIYDNRWTWSANTSGTSVSDIQIKFNYALAL